MADPVATKPGLLVFIHGWDSSSPRAWGRFPQLVREDPALAARYHVDDFEYPTGKFGDGVSVSQVAEFLRTKMETEWRDFARVSIIAHSQGGLVARRYIADCFNRDRLCRVDRVLFFATPHLGAPAPWLVSKLPGASRFLHPQSLGLAVDSDDLFALFQAEDTCDAHLRVRTRFVVAADDRWVPPLSAAGSHGLGDDLILPEESHGSLVKPSDEAHASLQIARSFLLEEAPGSLVEADHRQPLLKQKWSAQQSAAEAETAGALLSAHRRRILSDVSTAEQFPASAAEQNPASFDACAMKQKAPFAKGAFCFSASFRMIIRRCRDRRPQRAAVHRLRDLGLSGGGSWTV